ncbi:MAG: hypothetical protein HY863_18565 [Chloroflexi bacterium]|nr:hypothetical protein [Chloroflexota bacterium]
MTVRVGKMTFSDWISLPYKGLHTDTFIFHIDALNGLPPFEYRDPLQRLAAHLNNKRHGASLWIQVVAPGEWYLMEVKRSLTLELGLSVPYAITPVGRTPEWLEFSRPPALWHSSNYNPPVVKEKPLPVSQEELKCMQVLARIQEGLGLEVASLAGLDDDVSINALVTLKAKGLAGYATDPEEPNEKKSKSTKSLTPYWQLTRKGLSLAMRSWGIPAGVEFTDRKEESPKHARTPHRHISRRWPAWLRSAYPHAEVWVGWSEVRLPETSVLPDGLAWGRIQGFETLFWLEVGDEHKSTEKIELITKTRLAEALEFCQATGVRLVYAQLSPNWVQKAAGWACVDMSEEVAVIMGNIRKFGKLPLVEWGRTTSN